MGYEPKGWLDSVSRYVYNHCHIVDLLSSAVGLVAATGSRQMTKTLVMHFVNPGRTTPPCGGNQNRKRSARVLVTEQPAIVSCKKCQQYLQKRGLL